MSTVAKFTTKDDVHEFPLIVSFPQGIPQNIEDMQINASQKSGKSVKTQITSKLNGVAFKGANFGELAGGKDGFKYAIAIHNTKNKQIRVIPTDHIYVLKPHLLVSEAPTRQSSMTYQERKQSLTEEFGSRKKKRALQAAQSNVISTENISGASALESSLTVKSPQANGELIRAAEQALMRNRGNKRSKN